MKYVVITETVEKNVKLVEADDELMARWAEPLERSFSENEKVTVRPLEEVEQEQKILDAASTVTGSGVDSGAGGAVA